MISYLHLSDLLLTFNLCTQLAKSFAVYYFKCVCHDEYLYSIFGFAIIAEMAGLVFFPKIAEKISREKVYAFACGLPIVGFVLLGAAGYIAPQNKVLVIVCCALTFLWIRSFTWSNNMLYGRCYRLWRSKIWCTK